MLDVLDRRIPYLGKGLVKVLSFFGAFSLEFYCIQEWFADRMIPKLYEKGWSNLRINIAIFLMVTAISWIASVVFKYFWKLVELPFTHKKKGEEKTSATEKTEENSGKTEKEKDAPAEESALAEVTSDKK